MNSKPIVNILKPQFYVKYAVENFYAFNTLPYYIGRFTFYVLCCQGLRVVMCK